MPALFFFSLKYSKFTEGVSHVIAEAHPPYCHSIIDEVCVDVCRFHNSYPPDVRSEGF